VAPSHGLLPLTRASDAETGRKVLAPHRYHEHFMPRSLLHSQFEVLEEPGLDENPITVPIEPQPHEIVARILSAMNIAKDTPSE
jgi:gluconate kinase